MPSKDRGVPRQTRDWGHPPEGAPRTVVVTALCKRPPTHTSQSLHYHSPSDPRPVKAVLQGSYHRSLRDLRFRGDDTNVPTLIFRYVLGEGSYPLARRLLRARVLRRTSVLSHPTKFSAPSPPVDPTEQLLPWSFSTTLALLPSYCRRLQIYRHSVGWADDHTCSDCHAVDHMGWPTSSAIPYNTCNGSPPGGNVSGTLLGRSVLGGIPQFADLHPIQIDFDSFHSLPCFENKFTLSLFNCQLKLFKCSFCALIVFQIVSL